MFKIAHIKEKSLKKEMIHGNNGARKQQVKNLDVGT